MLTMKSVLAQVVIFWVVSMHGAIPNSEWQPWRTPRNQGVNVLFCYLRIHNVECEYSDLVKEQMELTGMGPYSANTLVQIAENRGVKLSVVSLTLKEFESCERPFITYLTADTTEDGAFVLVMDSVEDEVFYIHGATASIRSMSVENFRRVWSGIVLLDTSRRNLNWMLFGLCFSGALAVSFGGGWLFAKRKGNRNAIYV